MRAAVTAAAHVDAACAPAKVGARNGEACFRERHGFRQGRSACTLRAGEMDILRRLPADARIGVGVVNQKHAAVEAVEHVSDKIRHAVELFGRDRVLLHPDCGFATFADNPVSSAAMAEQKLAAIAAAVRDMR